MLKKSRLIFLLIIISINLSIEASEIPLKLFALHSNEIKNIKISPDGKYLAAAVPVEDQTVLAFYQKQPLKPLSVARFRSHDHVMNFYWVNNNRVVYTRGVKRGGYEQLADYGELYAVNVDGSNNTVLFGYRAAESTIDTRIKKRTSVRAWPEVLNLLPDDPDHILILAIPHTRQGDTPGRIYRMNVHNGTLKQIDSTPISFPNVLADKSGKPNFITGYDKNGKYVIYTKTGEQKKWTPWQHNFSDDRDIEPVTYIKDNNHIIVTAISEHGTRGVYELNLVSHELKEQFSHDKVDPYLILGDGNLNYYGVKFIPDKSYNHFFDKQHILAKSTRLLSKAFPGQDITITSVTRDARELIFLVSSDSNPGDYYTFNVAKKDANYLLSKKEWLDPDIMANKIPITVKSRDNLNLHGYLTLPKGTQGPHPLVVLPHGGPIGVRDHWFFDTTVQALASRNYSVLQINYRGSGGYGDSFEESGHEAWGTKIQEDIIDATKWAINRNDIDKQKICIMGTSFGGYSALMSSVLQPDLFRCAIGIAGVYDLNLMLKNSAASNASKWHKVLQMYAGKNPEKLGEISPINHVEKLKQPVLIIHGGQDEIAKPDQAKKLIKQLKKHDKRYKTLIKETEGHGFYNENNISEMYEAVISFLDTNIGI